MLQKISHQIESQQEQLHEILGILRRDLQRPDDNAAARKKDILEEVREILEENQKTGIYTTPIAMLVRQLQERGIATTPVSLSAQLSRARGDGRGFYSYGRIRGWSLVRPPKDSELLSDDNLAAGARVVVDELNDDQKNAILQNIHMGADGIPEEVDWTVLALAHDRYRRLLSTDELSTLRGKVCEMVEIDDEPRVAAARAVEELSDEEIRAIYGSQGEVLDMGRIDELVRKIGKERYRRALGRDEKSIIEKTVSRLVIDRGTEMHLGGMTDEEKMLEGLVPSDGSVSPYE